MEKRPALGKGLSALIPDASDALTAPRATVEVDIDQLEPNQYQPRAHIDDARLDDLARSIKANGVIQPIVVRKIESALSARDRYQIIAGERRWRAAQKAQLTRVPIVVKDVANTDRKRLLEMALIENIQREDLNPMEAAAGYQRLAYGISIDAGRHCLASRQGSRDGGELPAPAEASRRSPRQRGVGRALDGPRPGDRGADRRERPAPSRAGRGVARPLGARDRGARQERRSTTSAAPPPRRRSGEEQGRAHARGRRAAEDVARHTGRNQAKGERRNDCDLRLQTKPSCSVSTNT